MRIYSLDVARNLIAEKNGKGFANGVFMLLDDEANAMTKAAVKAALTPNDEEINVMVDAARESLPIANPLGLAPVVGNVAALSRYRASCRQTGTQSSKCPPTIGSVPNSTRNHCQPA